MLKALIDLAVLGNALRAKLYLPVALGAVIHWAEVMTLDLIGCASMAFATLICYVEGHAEGLLVSLPIRLDNGREKSKLTGWAIASQLWGWEASESQSNLV